MEDFSNEDYKPKTLELKEVVEETPNIKTFYVNCPEIAEKANPGEFVMLWVMDSDEIPISLSKAEKGGRLGLTVENVGEATAKLHELREGDLIGVRGPYGNGFDLTGEKILMVCGGCGSAPLAYVAEEATKNGKKVTYILAAKSSGGLLFKSRLEKYDLDLVLATEDGSSGIKGLATDALEEELKENEFDSVLTCGPEIMMVKTAEITEREEIPTQLSLERYMKCGIGICGQCAIDPNGLRVCKEGPVFKYEEIKDSEFGEYSRDSKGEKVKF